MNRLNWTNFNFFAAIGAVATLLLLNAAPDTDSPYIEPIRSVSPDGTLTESFIFRSPEDGIAVTHSGDLPMAAWPPGIGLFSEAAIERGLVIIARVRNTEGAIVGFAVEYEVHPPGDMLTEDLRWDTDWVVVLPGRGMLALYQWEHSGELGPKVIRHTRTTGKDWIGDWTVQTTVGPRDDGQGIIVGGTGEFAGATGTFVEIDRVTRFTTDGALMGEFELRVARAPTR
jgi:hypothetical protein